jgi:hypothetical protein
MCNRNQRNPVQCIVPPYMQEKIWDAENVKDDEMADAT